jgi:hypothetical protein
MIRALVVTLALVGCGSKKPAPATTSTGTGMPTPVAKECCCAPTDTAAKHEMMAPDACKAKPGSCLAEEDTCHGIEGPIP